jgi:SSS family transporter
VDRTLDYVIIVAYLVGVAIFGIITGGRQKTVKDYFLGAKSVPWWAVCFSIVAAETSTLTFISVPGLAYLTNLNFLQVTFGYFIGRIIVALFFLPSYFSGELSTAYAFLERRFGKRTRSYASVVFLFTRTAADGVRLFATAIPLKLMLDISYPAAIIIIAVITLIYTSTGGVKGVIWVDMIQMFIYLGGALLAGYFLIYVYLPEGWETFLGAAAADGKLSIFNLGFGAGLKEFFAEPYTLLGGLIGGAFLSMASHGTDQLIVQRLLTVKDLRSSKKAIVGSGAIIVIQFAVFLLVGVALFAYYGSIDIKSDEIFPKFIIENLPVGISGIIIAGLFAAAMSTIAGSISSLSSSTMLDLYQPLMKGKKKRNELLISRIFTFVWAVLLVGAAIFFMESSQAVVELALSIASFTYGGLLGTFMLGLFIKRVGEREALIAFSFGIGIMVLVVIFNIVAWTWYTLVGVVSTMLAGYALSFFKGNRLSDNN